MPTSEQIDRKLVGTRLAEARVARGMTQEDAAAHLGCNRSTLIAIEKGTRSLKAKEIVEMAELYGQKVGDIVRPAKPFSDLQPNVKTVAQQMKVDDVVLAIRAYLHGDLSEGELAGILRCDYVSAREFVERYRSSMETSEE